MTEFVEVCYVVSDDNGRMLVNGSYGMLTHSLVLARKYKDVEKAGKRRCEQNDVTARLSPPNPLAGVTFKVVPVELRARLGDAI